MAMDLSAQSQQQNFASQTSYDPSQLEAYNQSTQSYYAYHHQYPQLYSQQQLYPSYIQEYPNPYQQQSREEPTSIHPPGVPISPQPTPTQLVGSEQWYSHYPHGFVDQQPQQQQQLNSSVQWQGMHGGPHPLIGQSPYRGAGRRGGRPFRGGGRGHFGPRPDGSGPPFRSRGRGQGCDGNFPPSSTSARAEDPAKLTQGDVYGSNFGQAALLTTPIWPPPRMAWCELCRVDCNTPEILEQHKNGKRHKKNLHVYEELQKLNKLLVGGPNEQMTNSEFKPEAPDQHGKPETSKEKKLTQEKLSFEAVTDDNKVETEQQKISEEAESTEEPSRKSRMDHFEARGRGFKRKMRGGRGGKWMRTYEGSRRLVEPPKPKEIVPLMCELCKVKCESPIVFESHLTGKKHLSNLKRFQGHQAMLGQAALQALYPALEALFPALQVLCQHNANASTSSAPQYHQQGMHGSEGFFTQPGPSMFVEGQASASGPVTVSASAPSLVLEIQNDQKGYKLEGSPLGGGSQNAVAKSDNGPSEFRRKEVDPPINNSAVEQLVSTVTAIDLVSFGTAVGGTIVPE